jgi:hypothetical protein
MSGQNERIKQFKLYTYRKINNDLFKIIVQLEWLKLKILQNKNRNCQKTGVRNE